MGDAIKIMNSSMTKKPGPTFRSHKRGLLDDLDRKTNAARNKAITAMIPIVCMISKRKEDGS